MLSPPRRTTLLGAVSACAVLLGACATLPARTELPTIASVERFTAAESLAAPAAAWPSDQWWIEFGDPQLNALIEEGVANAADIRAAQARFARAEAFTMATRSRLFPSINASGELGQTRQSYNYLIPEAAVPHGWNDYGQAAISLNWEIDFWGRNRAALAAASSDADAARAEAASTRLAVSAGIASAYADFASLYAEYDATIAAIEVRSRTLELIEARRAQGLENDGAVARAQSSLAVAEGERAALEEALALTRNRLAALVGAGPDRGLSLERPSVTAHAAFGLPANLPANLIGRRPDIIAARLRAEAAASRIDEARAAFYPNVNLTALIGVQALGVGDLLDTGSQLGSVGPAVNLPIFNAGRLQAQHRAASSEYEIAVAQYDGALTQALREVADVAVSERALTQRLDNANAAERAATSAWTVANDRYRGGLATYLDVLVAEDALIAARRNVASLRARAFVLDVALTRALGGGFQS